MSKSSNKTKRKGEPCSLPFLYFKSEQAEKQEKMIYYINGENEIISSEAFINCGNEMRDRLCREYRELTLEEMIAMADEANTWDEYDPEWYEKIAELTELNINDYDDLSNLIKDAKKA